MKVVVVEVLLFCLLVGCISCNEPMNTQLTELRKYKDFIETTNQKELNRVLKTIDRCSERGDSNPGLLTLKTTILLVHENFSTQLALVDPLRSKAELEALKEKVLNSIQAMELSKDVSSRCSNTLQTLKLNSLSVEEARVVLKANMLLIEKEIRDHFVGQWAIDC